MCRRLIDSDILEQFADLFDGKLGLMEGDIHLETDPNVKPVQMPLRRLPIALGYQVEDGLRKSVNNGVIAPVTKPTPWFSALLIVRKATSGRRPYIDPKVLNPALARST